jgi:NADH-ubiquinone oxidoreductase chain 4
MLLSSLLLTPILGVLAILINRDNGVSLRNIKFIALTTSILNFFISLIIFILFDFSTNQFQFVQEYHEISYFDFYLGVDGLSIYFILLTTIIIPISLVSNWKSITKDVESYVIIILLLETLLLAVFLVLDILLFYIFFESILPPLFILIGIFGSDNRVKASFYLFLYTLLGSLFLLLSILAMSSIMSTTDFDTLFKGNFIYLTQLFLFYGIFIAFAVKTPTIFLNTWLLKAHVESPLGGSIILAAIVLKLSLYGILRLILPVLPKAYMEYTYIIFLIGVITIVYASLSTLRTIDIKELIAYSSVSHAAVYLLGVFSNSIQGIEGAINLGLAHGLVSPGLFICAGGVLYDRSSTRVISFYRGVTQVMPFFILCLANCGAPLSLNFIGEFLSLYGVFERSSLFGVFASSSIIFSAAYTIYMYQRIAFGGAYSRMFTFSIPDLTKREFTILLILVIPTVLFGVYPAPILDAIHYSVSTLIYVFDGNIVTCDSANGWASYFPQDNTSYYPTFFALLFWFVVVAMTIKHSHYIKKFYLTRGKLVLLLIVSNVSLSTIYITFYVLSLLYSLTCTIEHVMYNELATYYDTQQCLTPMGADFHPIPADSLSAKDHVFLSSNNPSSNTGDTGGEGSRPSIFTNPDYRRPASPEQVAVPLEGQGDNPTLFTAAKPGEPRTPYNSYNTSDGTVDSCEQNGGANHGWNPRNTDKQDKPCYNGSCYNCKTQITTRYHACDSCGRHICGACDSNFSNHASYTFVNHIASLKIRFPR